MHFIFLFLIKFCNASVVLVRVYKYVVLQVCSNKSKLKSEQASAIHFLIELYMALKYFFKGDYVCIFPNVLAISLFVLYLLVLQHS